MSRILLAEHIDKSFQEPETFQVLKDINFSVQAGEFIALVGKSGSGKSTLLYILSTLDTEYEGSLTINNKLVTGDSQDALAKFRNENIGFVFQFHFLLPEFSVLENVMIPALKARKFSFEQVEENAISKLRQMGMDSFARKPSGKLSGGQQQRVAIARALINDPAIIMTDEPTGNLDSINAGIVLDILNDLSKNKGNTIISVTHDLDFAKKADRILELVDGKLKD